MAEKAIAIVRPNERQFHMAQEQAASKAESMATQIEGITSSDGAVVRSMLPYEDLESGSGNSWNGTDREWTQDGLTADSANEVYTIDSNSNAQNKIFVFYGLLNVATDVLSTEVEFQDTTGATFFKVGTQSLEIDPETALIFNKPVVYGATEDGAIDQWCGGTAGNDQMVYLAQVVEKKGETFTPHAGSN